MAENNSNSDAFSGFSSSVFIHHQIADERDNIAVSQRVLGKYQIQTPLGITLQATLPNMM